jgi:DnaJ-class molecular chaperone
MISLYDFKKICDSMKRCKEEMQTDRYKAWAKKNKYIECDACDGTGVIIVGLWVPSDGDLDMCEECGGRGEIKVKEDENELAKGEI